MISKKYSYKDGFIEAVVFIFQHKDKVLIENRPNGPEHDGPMTYFFPSGKIEIKDHEKSGDYKINALKREVSEEFDHKISFDKFIFLGEVPAPPINIHFYVYLMENFSGNFPKHTVEDGLKFADLFWINLNERKKYFIHDTAFEICDLLDTHAL